MKKIYLSLLGLLTFQFLGAQVLSEGFEGGSIPTGWTQEQVSGSEDWEVTDQNGNNSITPRTGAGMAHFQVSATIRTDRTKLITPQLDLTSLTVPELKFFFANAAWGSDITELRIFYKSDAGDPWTQLGQDYITAHETWTEVDMVLPNPSNDYYIAFEGKADYARGVNLDDINIAEAPTCPRPSALAATNITATSADLSWTEVGSATTWNIEYGVAGFTQGSGTVVSGLTATTHTATLLPITDYEFYVQSECSTSDLSTWEGPFAFSNDYCGVSTTSGEYLTEIATDGADQDISYAATAQPAGSYADSTAQTIISYATQQFEINTTYSSGSNGVNVWVDWNNDFDFDASELVASLANSSASKTQVFTVPGGTPVGDYRMRVRGQWGSSANPPACGSVSYGSTVDFTLSVVTPPDCLPVMNIDTVATTTTSIELEWDEFNSSNTWNIEYGTSGFTQGTGTAVVANSNPFDITGLSPSTGYDFYVQSDCDTDSLSLWKGPFSVYTACGVAVAPFYEGFNNGVQPQCWENLSSNTTSTSSNNLWSFNEQGDYAAGNNGKSAGEFTKVDGNSPYTDSVMLITPEIDISQLTNAYLSFEWFSNNTNNPGDNVPLIVELYDGSSWNLLDTLKGDDPEWQFVNYDLSAYANDIIQIRFMVNKSVTTSYSYYNDILLDEVRIDDCLSLGGEDGSLDVCRLDNTVNLNDNIIVKPNGGGKWSFPEEPSYLTEDSILNVTYLPAGSYEVYYVERFVCYDTTVATINVFNKSAAGVDGTTTACKNEPINLYEALSGNVDLGGEWIDYNNAVLPTSQPKAPNVPGQYNFTYIADNGVCPADTATVVVVVKPDCDFLSLSEELFTDISVFPNPATSQINIVNPTNTASLKVEMLDMNGRIVLVEDKALNNASEATLAIDHLEKGIYTLRVYNSEGQKTFKIVKQ